MLKIRTKEQQEGKWFTFQDVDGVEFKIRHIGASVMKEFHKKCSTKVTEFKDGKVMHTEKIDNDQYNDTVTDYLIEDWKGVGDDQGNALECNLGNKKEVMDNIDIYTFVWNCAKAIEIGEEAEKKILKD